MPKGKFFNFELERTRNELRQKISDEFALEQRRRRRADAQKSEEDTYLCGVAPEERIYEVLNGPSLRGLEQSLFDTLPGGKRRKVIFTVLLEYKSGYRSIQAGVWIKQVRWSGIENQWEIGGDISIPTVFGDNTKRICGHFIGTYDTQLRRGAFTFLNL